MTTDISYYHEGDNAALMGKLKILGYFKPEDRVLDATYGRGTWWKRYRPDFLVGNDADLKAKVCFHEDFTAFPAAWRDGWDVVCYDPPYKLNGTGGPDDARYGCEDTITVPDRLKLVYDGLRGCMKIVKPRGYLLVKCQDQVAGGRVRWMSHNLIDIAARHRFFLVERFDMPPARPQPLGRKQKHARRGSTLLVFKRER